MTSDRGGTESGSGSSPAILYSMRSYLVVNTPRVAGNDRSVWSLSGSDDREVRDCLSRLDEFIAGPNEALDRWQASLVLYDADSGLDPALLESPKYRRRAAVRRHVLGAWTAEALSRLVELLPDTQDELRSDLAGRAAEAS